MLEPSTVHLNRAICLFRQGSYEEAEEAAHQVAESPLRTRLLMHLAQGMGRTESADALASQLRETDEDLLSRAALRVRQGRYESAVELYKSVLERSRDDDAVHFYAAVSYSYLEFYDGALEHVEAYLEHHPESLYGSILKASLVYKVHGAEAALAVLYRAFPDPAPSNPLLEHNRAVFQNGDDGYRVWTSMAESLPEAATNLVLYHLKRGQLQEAEKLTKATQPQGTTDYLVKGLVAALLSQQRASKAQREKAQRYLELVGSSETERDTILGRQCMAFSSMLNEHFEDALVFLESIQEYVSHDDIFKWNYALCLVEAGRYTETIPQLEAIQDDTFKEESAYGELLARCYVANGLADYAWALFLRFETHPAAQGLLEQIADDCYLTSAFQISARAFDLLHRLDPQPDYWRGKRGAILGAFRNVLAHREPVDCLDELLQMLVEDTHPEATPIREAIWQWSQNNVT